MYIYWSVVAPTTMLDDQHLAHHSLVVDMQMRLISCLGSNGKACNYLAMWWDRKNPLIGTSNCPFSGRSIYRKEKVISRLVLASLYLANHNKWSGLAI